MALLPRAPGSHAHALMAPVRGVVKFGMRLDHAGVGVILLHLRDPGHGAGTVQTVLPVRDRSYPDPIRTVITVVMTDGSCHGNRKPKLL